MNKKKQADKKKAVDAKAGDKPKKSAVRNRTAAAPATVSDDEIRIRAYFKYVTRGGHHGSHENDWFEAEKEQRCSNSPTS